MSRFSIGHRALLGAALLLSAPIGAHAQATRTQHTITADDRALHSYTLTMDKLRKFKQAGLNMLAYAKAHPDEAKRWEKQSGGDDQTLEGTIHAFESIPPAKHAIESAGLTTRDYMLTSMAFFQAAMIAGMTKTTPDDLPYSVNPKNIAFMRAHKAEIEQLDLGALTREGNALDSSQSSHPRQP